MRWTAGSRCGVVWKHDHAGSAKQIRDVSFRNVTAEFDTGIRSVTVTNRLPVSRSGVVIGAGDDEAGVGPTCENRWKCLHQCFQPLISAPVADGQNTLVGIVALREIRWAWTHGKCAMSSQQDIFRGVFFAQDAPVTREQYRN